MPFRIREDYKKIDLLLDLINILRARRMSKQEIKNFLSVSYGQKISDRTVFRRLAELKSKYRESFIQDVDGTYHLETNDIPNTLTESDIRDLHTIVQKAAYDSDLKTRLDVLENKLSTKLYNNIRMRDPRHANKRINDLEQEIQSDIIFIGPKIKTGIDQNIHEILNKSIARQKVINICYFGKKLLVCPLCIVQDIDNTYLIAFKKTEKHPNMQTDMIVYKTSEIEDITITNTWFQKPNSFSAQYFADHFFGISTDTKKYNIELLVCPDGVQEAKRYIFHNSQENIDNPDGSMTIKFKAAGLHPLCLYLMQWDGLIKPLAPKKLVQEFQNILLKYLDNIKQD